MTMWRPCLPSMPTTSSAPSANSTSNRFTATTSNAAARTWRNIACRIWSPNKSEPSSATPMRCFSANVRPTGDAVKHSIYVHPDHLNAGVGRRLLPALIDACTAAGCRQMIAYIDVANIPSQRLHETFGLEQAGLRKAVGFKYGRWADSILMQRALGAGGTAPPDEPLRKANGKPL